ncbi:hypothetical protein R3W88_008265 [Solanum pinnatisectum]|uniref:Uncharacterized protein n=1 Tax=Solanum pinnatisectum TaxID=50273 RepID=A0AAV9M815_9SOLN|nr:hypothetical protein R3W88_008265 [Solanum pinnatisectum]
MVGAIKNNGDRVVDTCVQDDTLNTTITLNCPLATVSQTLVLGAKDGVTSDSMVLVINLESDLISNPKLSTAGIQDSGQANKVQQCEENLGKFLSNTKIQQLDCTNPIHKEKTVNYEDKVSRKVVCSNTFDALMINSDQELHPLSTPILQDSNPKATRIIKESHAIMLNKENLMVKPHMATIKTSNHDVPNSPSLESLGEQIFGQ